MGDVYKSLLAETWMTMSRHVGGGGLTVIFLAPWQQLLYKHAQKEQIPKEHLKKKYWNYCPR